jgi:hypothetical protein
MKTLFWLFEDYASAATAVDKLLDADFDEKSMNVILLEAIAKDEMDVDWGKAPVKKSDEIGDVSLEGMARLVGGQQAVDLPNVGRVYAAGELATILAKTAVDPRVADYGLRRALVDLAVPEEHAQAYAQGIERGGVLVWLRVEDERAPEADEVLAAESAAVVASHGS